jgi:hypothetical protein
LALALVSSPALYPSTKPIKSSSLVVLTLIFPLRAAPCAAAPEKNTVGATVFTVWSTLSFVGAFWSCHVPLPSAVQLDKLTGAAKAELTKETHKQTKEGFSNFIMVSE